jgi:serine/threonine-protein kinase
MSEEIIGTQKGDYEILAVLGVGGMGKVYKVRNVLSDRIEAMKVLLPNLADQKELAERFLREIKVLASLSHPNIAALRTALTIDNQLVMIMEYLEGITLSARMEQGPIPLGEALAYVSQVLAALSYAHKQRVIHRDIKPSNMMLTPEGIIKLMDFGIARSGSDTGLTMTGTTMGSLSYMSPEQVKCTPVDARSDLYSLGVSLYEMVTGQRPFQADSHFSILQAHLREVPRPPVELKPDLPVAVSKIILKAMEKVPDQRFQSADDFLDALQAATRNLGPTKAFMQATAARGSLESGEASRRVATVQMTGGRAAQMSSVPIQTLPNVPAPVQQLSVKRYRGLYIGLGALIVVLVLVAAGISAPNWLKTRAKEGGASSASKQSSPKPAEAGTHNLAPANSTPVAASPASNETPVEPTQPSPSAAAANNTPKNPPATASSSAAAKNHASSERQSPPRSEQQADGDTGAQQATSEADQLAELDHQTDLLSGRETAIGASLDGMQRQQNAQGFQLRGDIVAAQSRMRTYLTKAQAALQAHDLKNAKKYLDLAEPEAEKIERFLGR